MAHVITDACIDIKDRACVACCPVDCIYEGLRTLYIQPDECINCGLCVSVCPVDAIYDEPDVPAAQRRDEYNTRQLADGAALPYFIWPNVDPFRRATLISESVFPPAELRQRARDSRTLNRARNAVRAARQARVPGTLFDPQQPLRLAAFELRFLADKRPPHRPVIDLAAANAAEPIMWPAEAYFVVPNPEDRLHLPPEYVPLFRQNLWREPTAQELVQKIAGAPNVGPTGLPL